MYTFLVIILIIVSILLVVSVLMQSSKGDGMAAMTGGSSVLGGRGVATFLSKFTQWAGVAFFVLILAINIMIVKQNTASAESVVKKQAGAQIATPASGLPMPSNVEVEQPTAPIEPAESE
ncbi:MAG: preprotein translocase subunit SecG [Candidatus Marinimicrobia bacterium]|nr:preprotein translocase subunit SecG [Candidatus Neomarinimicrobiota bacterium]